MLLSSSVGGSFIKALSRAEQREGHQRGIVKYLEASISKKLFLPGGARGESVGGAERVSLWRPLLKITSKAVNSDMIKCHLSSII